MKKALNQNGIIINILESYKEDIYKCPVCGEILERKFGKTNQFFAHPKGKGEDCENKLHLILKEEKEKIDKENSSILDKFYNKKFDNISIEYPEANFLSEEGYPLTKEQVDIIQSKENRIIVSALAGSSKTTTLYYYAKERPTQKFLYIVYNKAMKTEAEKTFGKLSNVEIKTMHGLAYKYFGRQYSRKLSFNYGAYDVLKDLKLNYKKDMQLASQINMYLNQYRLSDIENFEDLEIEDLKNLKSNDKNTIIRYCKKLWDLKKNTNNNIGITHDFYLKLFQLSKQNLSKNYDGLLIDESQDASLLILDIIENSKISNIVMVGDKYQSLYKWRNSVNIMEHFKVAKEYKLTTSFRVSQNIAEFANMLVTDMANENINMKGFNKKQKIVNSINTDKPYACLCRTNAHIFAHALENSHKKLYFEGGFKSYRFNDIRDAYDFYCGKETKNKKFNKFKDYNELISYAKETEDIELISIDKTIEKYGSNIPKLVSNISKQSITNKSDADIILTTIHKSKGQTFSIPILISNDHYKLSNVEIDKRMKKDIFEDMCLLYVAITRCADQIELSQSLKMYLAEKLKD